MDSLNVLLLKVIDDIININTTLKTAEYIRGDEIILIENATLIISKELLKLSTALNSLPIKG
jgi:hypothetical protein